MCRSIRSVILLEDEYLVAEYILENGSNQVRDLVAAQKSDEVFVSSATKLTAKCFPLFSKNDALGIRTQSHKITGHG